MSLAAFRRARATASVPVLDLFSALPVPVLALDPDDRPLRVNLAAEQLLNTSAPILAERGLGGLLVDGISIAEILFGARAQGGGHSAFDVEIGFAGQRVHRADLLIAPLSEAPGWLILTLQTRSVASLVERQAVHRGAARSATGVAAMLAHEIKNPLSGIRGAAQLLQQTAADPDAAELTTLICAEVDRIRDLVDRMEGFTDTRALPRAPENIHAILGHVRRVAEQGFARGINLRESYDPSLPLVAAHRDSLVQVFLNLVKNAVEAAGSEAKITITTAYRQGLRIAAAGKRKVSLPIEVCVVDTGPGAPRDLADHLFDPFVTTKRGGRGLGLALVAKIVGDHGGIVEYERVGERTVFRVLLPTA